MKAVCLLICLFFVSNFILAQKAGALVTASNSGKQLFTVGDIFIQGNTGVLGSLNYISSVKLDVSDLDIEDDFVVYPNPTIDFFEIKNKGIQEIKSIHVVDIKGSKMNIQNNDVTQLLPGVYFIQINDKKVIKLIKN
jgi:hypothetical protein